MPVIAKRALAVLGALAVAAAVAAGVSAPDMHLHGPPSADGSGTSAPDMHLHG
jgi:hypothetical protein